MLCDIVMSTAAEVLDRSGECWRMLENAGERWRMLDSALGVPASDEARMGRLLGGVSGGGGEWPYASITRPFARRKACRRPFVCGVGRVRLVRSAVWGVPCVLAHAHICRVGGVYGQILADAGWTHEVFVRLSDGQYEVLSDMVTSAVETD